MRPSPAPEWIAASLPQSGSLPRAAPRAASKGSSH
jgi:hypothetical protein